MSEMQQNEECASCSDATKATRRIGKDLGDQMEHSRLLRSKLLDDWWSGNQPPQAKEEESA